MFLATIQPFNIRYSLNSDCLTTLPEIINCLSVSY